MGGGDPNGILNECRDIDRGVDEVDRNLEQLRMLQQRTLDDADSSASSANNRQLDALSSETMALYRSLTERVRLIKSNPDSRTPKNNPQVSRVDRRLKAAIQQYQQIESQFRKRTQDQMARQYRIVRPNASEDEVRAAVEDTSGGQVFSQALMQSDRQGRARAALTAVQDRHTALVKIEQQMVELAQLFQDMDTLVVQQEAAVMQIEQKGEEVVDNLDKGNQEIGVAVDTARKTRKKKWICLGICGMFSFPLQSSLRRILTLTQCSSSSLSSSSCSSTSSSSAGPTITTAAATRTAASAASSRRWAPRWNPLSGLCPQSSLAKPTWAPNPARLTKKPRRRCPASCGSASTSPRYRNKLDETEVAGLCEGYRACVRAAAGIRRRGRTHTHRSGIRVLFFLIKLLYKEGLSRYIAVCARALVFFPCLWWLGGRAVGGKGFRDSGPVW